MSGSGIRQPRIQNRRPAQGYHHRQHRSAQKKNPGQQLTWFHLNMRGNPPARKSILFQTPFRHHHHKNPQDLWVSTLKMASDPPVFCRIDIALLPYWLHLRKYQFRCHQDLRSSRGSHRYRPCKTEPLQQNP